jgi:hypothetical protein
MDPAGNSHLSVAQFGAGRTTMARLWQQEAGVGILD